MSIRKLTFWGLLGAAVLSLGRFFEAWRSWRAVPTLDHAAAVVVLGLTLVVVMAWLGFLLYEVDRAAGRIRHQVAVYEWVIAMRRPEVPGPAARAKNAQTGQEVAWRPEVPRQTGQEVAWRPEVPRQTGQEVAWRPEVPRQTGGSGR